jgi:hypothetical protein
MECLNCSGDFVGRSDKKFCCDNCRNIFNHNNNKEKSRSNKKQWYINNKEKVLNNTELKMYNGVKYRAKKHNIPFDLELSDIVIPDICPLLGIPLYKTKGRVKNNTPSLDKIDPSKGYIKNNVWVISWKANRVKSNLSIKETVDFCTNLLNKIKECDA